MNKSRRSKQVQFNLWQIRNTPSDSELFNRLQGYSFSSLRAGCFPCLALIAASGSFSASALLAITPLASRLGRLGRRGGCWLAQFFGRPAIAQFHLGREATCVVDLCNLKKDLEAPTLLIS